MPRNPFLDVEAHSDIESSSSDSSGTGDSSEEETDPVQSAQRRDDHTAVSQPEVDYEEDRRQAEALAVDIRQRYTTRRVDVNQAHDSQTNALGSISSDISQEAQDGPSVMFILAVPVSDLY